MSGFRYIPPNEREQERERRPKHERGSTPESGKAPVRRAPVPEPTPQEAGVMLASLFGMDAPAPLPAPVPAPVPARPPGLKLSLSSARKPTTETELRVQLTDRVSRKVVLDESVPWTPTADSLEDIGSRITARGVAELLHSEDRRLEFLVWFSDVLDRRALSDEFNARSDTDISLVRFREGASIMRTRADARVLELLRQCTDYLGEGSFHIVGKACASPASASADSADSVCRACVAVKITKTSGPDQRREKVEFDIQKLLADDPEFAPFVPAVFGSHEMNLPIMGLGTKTAQTQEFLEPWVDPDMPGTPIRSMHDFLERCLSVLPRARTDRKIELIKRVLSRVHYIVARIVEFLVRLQARYPGARHNDLHLDNILLSRPKHGVGTPDGDLTYARLGYNSDSTRLDVPRVVVIDWEFADIPGHQENPQIRQARPTHGTTTVLQWTGPEHGWMRRATNAQSSDERRGRCAYYCDLYDFCRFFAKVNEFYRILQEQGVLTSMHSWDSVVSAFRRARLSRSIPPEWCLTGREQYDFNRHQDSGTLPTLALMFANFFVGRTVLEKFPRFERVHTRVTRDLWTEDRFSTDKDVYLLVESPADSRSFVGENDEDDDLSI